jgi:release factor glutamine methyltransferase
VTLRQALSLAADRLAALTDVDNPRLEAEILLRYALEVPRSRFFLDLDMEILPEKETLFWQWVERRLQGEPVAYIIRCREFFGLDFYVDQRVLIPRPETELLVEEALNFARDHDVNTIADIGTGSGAIAVSLALNLPSLPPGMIINSSAGFADNRAPVIIYATDISHAALEVAAINIRRYSLDERIILLQGDLLDSLAVPVDLVAANLPYVTREDVRQMPSASYEPRLALDGGESGLKQVFRLIDQLPGKVNPGGCVLLEIGMGQSGAVVDRLYSYFPSAVIEVLPDLAGIDRAVKMTFNDR